MGCLHPANCLFTSKEKCCNVVNLNIINQSDKTHRSGRRWEIVASYWLRGLSVLSRSVAISHSQLASQVRRIFVLFIGKRKQCHNRPLTLSQEIKVCKSLICLNMVVLQAVMAPEANKATCRWTDVNFSYQTRTATHWEKPWMGQNWPVLQPQKWIQWSNMCAELTGEE